MAGLNKILLKLTLTQSTVFRFTLFSAHPVLGSIMALVALEDLEPGQEVFGEYGYCDQTVYRDFTRDTKLHPDILNINML